MNQIKYKMNHSITDVVAMILACLAFPLFVILYIFKYVLVRRKRIEVKNSSFNRGLTKGKKYKIIRVETGLLSSRRFLVKNDNGQNVYVNNYDSIEL